MPRPPRPALSSVQEYLHEHNHLLHVKYGYLNLWGSWVGGWLPFPGWVIRYFLYFIFLGFGALTLYRYSVSQDLTGDVRPTLSARRFSCGWLPIFALALTFASYRLGQGPELHVVLDHVRGELFRRLCALIDGAAHRDHGVLPRTRVLQAHRHR